VPAKVWRGSHDQTFYLRARYLLLPEVDRANQDMADWPADPEVLLALTPRSGPIVIEMFEHDLFSPTNFQMEDEM
jgi:hypothetical protein